MKMFFVVLFSLMSLIIYGQVKFPKEVIKYHKIKEIKQYGHDSTFYYSSQYSKKGELIGIKYLNSFKQDTTVLFSDNSFFGVKDLDSSFFKKRGKWYLKVSVKHNFFAFEKHTCFFLCTPDKNVIWLESETKKMRYKRCNMGGYYRRTIKHKYNYNEEEKSIFVYGKISDKSPYKERNRKERGSYTFILKVKFYN